MIEDTIQEHINRLKGVYKRYEKMKPDARPRSLGFIQNLIQAGYRVIESGDYERQEAVLSFMRETK